MYDEYKHFLIDLTREERDVFWFCFVLKYPPKKIYKDIKLDLNFVVSTLKSLNQHKKYIALKEKIIEVWLSENI